MTEWNKEYPESNDEKLVWMKDGFFDIGYCDFNIDNESIREWWINTSETPSKNVLIWTELPPIPF